MRARCVVLALALVATGCVVSPPQPDERPAALRAQVAGDEDTEQRFSGVLGLMVRKGDVVARCTGTLVTPDLMLTARHCVAVDDGALVTCGASPLGAAAAPEDVLVTALPSMSDFREDYVPAAEIFAAPGGDDTCGFDLAALRLVATPPGASAVHAPRFDVPVSPGELFTAVGYGSDGTSGVGTRRFLETASAACAADDCELPEVQVNEWQAEDGSFCRADSGAAALDSEGRLIGSVSRGQNPCATPILAAMPPWEDWLVELARSAATAGGYETPEWARAEASVTEPPNEGGDEPELQSSCTLGGVGRGPSERWWLALLLAALPLVRRVDGRPAALHRVDGGR